MNINDLYQKVQEFEDSVSKETKALSHCKKGCSRCCYVDLSIFQVEADNIRTWFKSLLPEQKEELRKKWREEGNPSACTFLRQEACTIYQARPLICRTQGLAFKFQVQGQVFLDICPLNEKELEIIQQKEILNLDLINLILSELEKSASPNLRERVKLTTLIEEFKL